MLDLSRAVIRPAKADAAEILAIATMQAAAWEIYFTSGLLPDYARPAFTIENFAAERAQDLAQVAQAPGRYLTLVAELDGRIIGVANGGRMTENYLELVIPFLSIHLSPSEIAQTGCSNEIYLAPDAQRGGLGSRLLAEQARRMLAMNLSRAVTFAQHGHYSPQFFTRHGAIYLGSFNAELHAMLRDIKGITIDNQPDFPMQFDVYLYPDLAALATKAAPAATPAPAAKTQLRP